MDIKNRLFMSAGISIILVVIFFSLIFVASGIIDELSKKHELVDDMRNGIAELDLVAYDYLLYGEKRMEQQWSLKYNSLVEILDEAEEEMFKLIRDDFIAVDDVFSQVTINFKKKQKLIQEKAPQKKIDAITGIEERLVSQLLITSHLIITNVSKFAEEVYVEESETRRLVENLNLILILILVLTVITLPLLVARSISKPLYELTNGAEIIGKGNIKHKIIVKGKNEIAQLASSFNKMTKNLQEITVSRDELEKEVAERKKTEDALRESREMFTLITESSIEVIYQLDLEGKILYMNPAGAGMYGYDQEEMEGMQFSSLLTPERVAEGIDYVKKVLAGESVKGEMYVKHRDGHEIIIQFSMGPIIKDGEIVGFSGHSRDITERRKTEKALRFQFQLNKAITDNAASCLFMMDKQGHPTFMNPAAGEVTGYTLDEIREMPLHDAIHYRYPDGRPYPISECPIDNAQAELVSMDGYEDIFVRKDGTLFPVVCYIEPLEQDGEVIGSVLEFRDVTEQKKAEEALRESEGRLSTFMSSATDGFVLYDSDLTLVKINKSALKIFPPGTKEEDLIGMKMLDISPGRKETGRYENYMKVLKTGKPFFVDDIIPHLKFGGIHLSIKAFKVGDGLGIIFSDITERKRAEEALKNVNQHLEAQTEELQEQSEELQSQAEELQQTFRELQEQNLELEIQRKQVEEATRLKSEFLSNMSHELRTPLNSVIVLSDVLIKKTKEKLSGDEFKYLGIIEKNGRMLLRLINDILDISKIESGKIEIIVIEFNLFRIIEDQCEKFEQMAKKKGLSLTNNTEENLLPIKNDLQKIEHILQNLIGNAIKFTEEGSVEINARIQKENILISVKDTGIGISNEEIPYIFDEFRQVDGSTSRKYEGTGLGLAIARKYVEILGGDISVESEIGTGSIFTLTIPLDITKITSVKNKYSELTPFEKNLQLSSAENNKDQLITGKRILLVEDNETAIIQIKDFLEEAGLKVDVAFNGREALKYVKTTIPDGIILDLMMPEIDGFEVIEKIRAGKNTERIPILIITAKDLTEADFNKLRTNGIQELVKKGDVNKHELLSKINSMFGFINKEENKESVKPGEMIPAEKAAPIMPNTGKNKELASILIIEDNIDNMTTLKAVLENKYNLYEAYDGVEGLKAAFELIPDLILLDISLPLKDGYQVLSEIRESEELKDIPVIVVTASAMPHDRDMIFNSGATDYLAKPFDSELLLKKLKEWTKREGS